MGAAAAIAAGTGAFYLYTAVALGWRGLRLGPHRIATSPRRRRRPDLRRVLGDLGLHDVRPVELGAAVAGLFVLGSLVGLAVFGGAVPALLLGGLAAAAPPAAIRHRQRRRVHQAQEAWPRLIEELRVLTGSLGRSIPQALFEVGRRAPDELRPAFDAAHRVWLLSTDFERTLAVLKERLDDPAADATCETLLVAHDLGGTDLDRRLEDLAEDRRLDIQGRKDARAKQAGARFARRFVLLVPAGMALAGMSVGNGRAAYGTAGGQAAVVVALVLLTVCWWWAGRLMRVPRPERVFSA